MNTATRYADHLNILGQRMESALAACGFDAVLIDAGSPLTAFRDDNTYPFRANPHFKHWLPLTSHPSSVLEIRPGTRPRLYYFQPKDYWHQPPAAPAGDWVAHFEIEVVTDLEQLRDWLARAPARSAWIGEPAAYRPALPNSHCNPTNLLSLLEYQRAYKTDYEIQCMAQANRIAARGHIAAGQAFHGGASELEIHQAYVAAAGVQEQELPYFNIVAMNAHSSILHYHGTDRQVTDQVHSLVIDAGAQFNGYASDITRSHARTAGLYSELLGEVDRIQQRLVEEIRIGQPFADLHWRAHHYIGEILQQFDLVRMDPSDMVARGVTNKFFPCGLGHFIGLQVHDVGGYLKNPNGETYERDPAAPFLRMVRNIEARMALTVEPGIYFADVLMDELQADSASALVNWPLLEQLRPCGGVRVEDCVIVHADSHGTRIENQSRDAFAQLSS